MNWKTTTFGEVVKLEQGLAFNKKNNYLIVDDGIPLLRITDLINNTESKFVDRNKVPLKFLSKPTDIIFTRTGQVGLVFKGRVGIVHNNCFRIIPFEGIDPNYVYWYLKQPSVIEYAKNLAGGVAQPDLGHDAFKSISFQYPPLPTQQKIAAILSTYDDLIENNTRRIKILEEMAQMIYREWFVNFRFPGYEGIPMMESELGLVPAGWEKKKISDVANLFRGRSYGSDNLVEAGGLPFLNLKCLVRDGGFRSSGIKRYQGPYKETQTATEGDIVIAVTDMTQERRFVAHAARIPRMEEPLSVLSMDLVKIVPKEGIYSEYLYGILRYSPFADEIKQHANGVNVLHLNPDRIGEYEFHIAPKELRQSYSEKIGSYQEMCDILQLKNTNLRRTRDLLLPKLISGEIDVSGLDIRIPEAL